VIVLGSTQMVGRLANWGEGQRKLAALSTNGSLMLVDGSHMIAWEHPSIVVAAIERIVAASRRQIGGI
jgi:hypothetical protein